MKVLLLVLFLSIAAARFTQDGNHAVYERMASSQEDAGKLWMAAHMPECAATLNAVEKDMKTELGKALKEALDKIVNGFKDRVQKVKGVVEKVTDKIKELKENLQKLGEEGKVKSKEAIDMVRKNVHDIIHTIIDSFHKKEDNLDHQLDEVSKLKIKDLLQQIRERIVEKIGGIREYIKEIAVDNEAVRQLKALLNEVSDSELAHMLNNILDLSGHEYRHLQDLFQKLKEAGAKTDGVLKDKITELTGWVHSLWQEGLKEILDEFRHVRSSLLEVISSTKEFSIDAIRETLKHLESYKEHLGDLYGKLLDSLKKVNGRF